MLLRDAEGRARLGGVLLEAIARRGDVPTPFYAYDLDAMVDEAVDLARGFAGRDHLVCYAVKANSAGRLVRRLARAGVGADVVSAGELEVCLGAGVPPERIVWSGVAKTETELDRALAAGILSVHAESVEELARLDARARAVGKRAAVSLRINPGVEADTHANIATGHDEAKFGVPLADVPHALAEVERSSSLSLVGLSAHVGSQMVRVDEYVRAAEVTAGLARELGSRGRALSLLDLGGGMGVDYGEGCPVRPRAFVEAAARAVAAIVDVPRLLCEPGRAIVAAHGVLVTRVVQTKRWSGRDTAGWVFLDAGMNDLARPAMYGARHRVEPLAPSASPLACARVGGPVCESSDDFGTYELPWPPPDLMMIRDAGAYGFTMASQYNGRALPAEVFVEGGEVTGVSRGPDAAEWARARLAT
ncbi:MAG: diaminopimelate decarboxylase [Polyangiaceae bacterium]|nr:diaminopimelate decarboxylase [Polyangiaceae bacterium]